MHILSMKPFGNHIIAEFIYCSKKILNDKEKIEEVLRNGIKNSGLSLVSLHTHKFSPMGITSIAIISESHIAIHTFPEARHASIDIFTCSPEEEKAKNLLNFLIKAFKPKTMRIGDVCRRGNPIEIKHADWITGFSMTGLELRYHIKKKIFEKRSKYQKIDIIENEHFGRMLFLDNDLQIAESDVHLYNQAMVSPILESKKEIDDVLILGGGDGGVAQQLLKHDIGEITIVDIDEDVIKASKKFLKKICRNAFRSDKVKVVIQDAYKFLDKKKKYDAIIYDLTMHPEAFIKMDREKYLSKVFRKISKSLKDDGIVTMQCCAELDKETLKMVKRILNKYFTDIKFNTVFIPSYCVNWIFASAKSK
jgi:spermidine synthase